MPNRGTLTPHHHFRRGAYAAGVEKPVEICAQRGDEAVERGVVCQERNMQCKPVEFASTTHLAEI